MPTSDPWLRRQNDALKLRGWAVTLELAGSRVRLRASMPPKPADPPGSPWSQQSSAADGLISATGTAMEQQMDGPAAAALQEGGGDALLGPGKIAATGGNDDDGTMGQHRRRQKAGGAAMQRPGPLQQRTSSWATEQTNGASCLRITDSRSCRRRSARGLWRSSYFSSTSALLSEQGGCGASDLHKAQPPLTGQAA